PRAAADGMLAALERQALEGDVRGAERTSRMVETLGHRMEDGGRAWQDPATGRIYRDVPIYVIRPDRRAFGPLELDGAQDPATEVLETPEDLLEQGYRDAALYGGTTRFVREVLPSLGGTSRIGPPGDLAGSLAGPRTKAVVVESPTNPSLDVVDLRAVCAAAHDHGVAVMVDNTFATPILQQPLRLGADLVMHSLTKALGGHSDLTGGALVGSRERLAEARSPMP